MSDAAVILELANSLDDEVKFTLEACEDLTQVPKMFRKMALKTIIKGAKKDGVTEIDANYANKYKP
jgi:hypothetical protein